MASMRAGPSAALPPASWRRLTSCGREWYGSRRITTGGTISRLPLPWPVVALMIRVLLGSQPRLAVLTLVAFVLYLRPSEALRITGRDLVRPLVGGCPSARKWSVVLHPLENLTPSKTGQYDECLLFDNPEFEWIEPVLETILRKTSPRATLSQATYIQWAKAFEETGEHLSICTVLGHPFCISFVTAGPVTKCSRMP